MKIFLILFVILKITVIFGVLLTSKFDTMNVFFSTEVTDPKERVKLAETLKTRCSKDGLTVSYRVIVDYPVFSLYEHQVSHFLFCLSTLRPIFPSIPSVFEVDVTTGPVESIRIVRSLLLLLHLS